MKDLNTHNERIAKMTFASVYPHYLAKVVKKNRTREELQEVIKWLTSFDNKLSLACILYFTLLGVVTVPVVLNLNYAVCRN